MVSLKNLNGWQRIWIVIAVIYFVFILGFIFINQTWEDIAIKTFYKMSPKILKQVDNLKKSSEVKSDSSLKQDNEEIKDFLSKLPDKRLKPKWQEEYDKLLKENLTKATKYIDEKYLEAMRNYNFTEAEKIKEYGEIRKSQFEKFLEIDAVIYGPSSPEWKKCLSEHWLYIENPEFESVLKGKHERYIAGNFVSDPKNKLTIIITYILIFIFLLLVYWLLPIVLLYFGGYFIGSVTKWVINGFNK